ncbi:ubiquinol-cytochrome-c reductase complex assembly factor 2-like [Asterias rubens]|uniref:ubiquinol-cytochrome-c reductase complex assembly factor 2-like n=1 Tax=Asterias rubens TaxID=7604 RepID=UPI00145525A8|nr:ubiquinol-cytochrome-c reductase complex assembly factor 2-like [Asterias rubens]
MAASRYRKFLRLIEEWPVDPSKRGRDLAAHLRKRVAKDFSKGESTKIDEKECDAKYDALKKIHTDFYRNKYPRMHDTSATGNTAEDCNRVMSTENIEEMNELNKSYWTRLKETMGSSKQ